MRAAYLAYLTLLDLGGITEETNKETQICCNVNFTASYAFRMTVWFHRVSGKYITSLLQMGSLSIRLISFITICQ